LLWALAGGSAPTEYRFRRLSVADGYGVSGVTRPRPLAEAAEPSSAG
jgi:hypothetical protein